MSPHGSSFGLNTARKLVRCTLDSYTISSMEIDEYLVLNSEGLIPGPNESKEEFDSRVQAIKESFHKQTAMIPMHRWNWANEQLCALYDFSPKWCAAIYSSKGLAPWQIAATWIDVKRFYTIQIRDSKWASCFINADEVLAHEAVHAARAAFDEPQAEEIFAYLTSSAKWRKVIGPIFQRPIEALIFMGLLMLGSFLQIFEMSGPSQICFWISALLCGGWSIRLFRMRRRLEKAAIVLKPYLHDPSKVRAVLFRLTDEEIKRLSQGHFEMGCDWRWQVLRAAYFN